MRACSYAHAIQSAADVVSEHGENPEYDRGVYNLLAEMFGVHDMFTCDRMDEIEAEVRAIKPIIPV